MNKFRCKCCSAEYEELPRVCTYCNNSNPAMWDVIIPPPPTVIPDSPTPEYDSNEKDRQKEEKRRKKEERKKLGDDKKDKKKIIIPVVIAAILLSAFIIGFNGFSSSPVPTTTQSPTTTQNPATTQSPTTTERSSEPAEVSKVNVMMADKLSQSELKNYSDDKNTPLYVFGTKLQRSWVIAIDFADNLSKKPSGGWDISKNQDGSVYVWLDNLTLHIAANGKIAPESCEDLFFGYSNLISVDFNDAFDTSEVTTMNAMFYDCERLKTIDLSNFNTSNVTDMRYMFFGCKSLEKIDVSSFDTSNVTDMGYMFYNCKSVEEFDVSSFDTSKVTTMAHMFHNCLACAFFNIESFTDESLTDVSYMFWKDSDEGDYAVKSMVCYRYFKPENIQNHQYFHK